MTQVCEKQKQSGMCRRVPLLPSTSFKIQKCRHGVGNLSGLSFEMLSLLGRNKGDNDLEFVLESID